MDGKKRILELESMVAGLRDVIVDTSDCLEGWGTHKQCGDSLCGPVHESITGARNSTQATAEAHDARIERRGRALGLREANKILARFFYAEPKAMKVYDLVEAKAKELEKEEG